LLSHSDIHARATRLGDPARGRVVSPEDPIPLRLVASMVLMLIAAQRPCAAAATDPAAARDSLFAMAANIVGGAAPAVAIDSPPVNTDFVLNDITPNPASVPVMIEYTLPRGAAINLTVHDPQGREVAHMACGLQAEGVHTVAWNGHVHGLPPRPGVYVVRLEYPGGQQSRRIVLSTKTSERRARTARVTVKTSLPVASRGS
jgi:hypothetical protein